MDYSVLREQMVGTQIMRRGIKDKRILELFRKVERHRFVLEENIYSAYDDCALPIEEGQTISQPYMVALMTDKLRLVCSDKVLEIGTGSGYQTAFLAELVNSVYTVEKYEFLSEKTRKLLGGLGYTNIHFKVGDGSFGWGEFAPYDKIIVTAAAVKIPDTLTVQLKTGGRMVIPVGVKGHQDLLVIDKVSDEKLNQTSITGCVFVPLQGKYSY